MESCLSKLILYYGFKWWTLTNEDRVLAEKWCHMRLQVWQYHLIQKLVREYIEPFQKYFGTAPGQHFVLTFLLWVHSGFNVFEKIQERLRFYRFFRWIRTRLCLYNLHVKDQMHLHFLKVILRQIELPLFAQYLPVCVLYPIMNYFTSCRK